jgi:hypothetical protein
MILPIQGSEFINARRVGGSVYLPLDPSSPKRSTNEGSACRDPKEPVSLWASRGQRLQGSMLEQDEEMTTHMPKSTAPCRNASTLKINVGVVWRHA